MTLVVVSEVELARGPSLIVATDSMLSGGYRWPRGPKLFTLGAACVGAFEGDTQFAYPLLINARNFVAFADNLSRDDAEPSAIFGRVQLDVSEAYRHLVDDPHFEPEDDACSLILAGWSSRVNRPVVWRLQQPAADAPAGTQWSCVDVVDSPEWREHRCFFAGNGQRDPVGVAWEDVRAGGDFVGPSLAYAAFLARLGDGEETNVGGAPQVAVLWSGRRDVLGTRDADGRRHLLGHRVLDGAYGLEYLDESLVALA